MRAIGKHIIVKEIKEQQKTSSGLLLTNEESDDMYYRKGLVKSVGDEISSIKEGETILFDRRRSFTLMLFGEEYTVTQEMGVILVTEED